jgi:hypothetical protein
MGPLNVARKIVPGRMKKFLRDQHRRFVFRRAMCEFVGTPIDKTVSEDVLNDLIYGWGNEAWSARSEYIQEFLRIAANVQGPILECGSGLSTLLLGVVAQRTGSHVFSLEHHPQWARQVRTMLDKYHIISCTVCQAELRCFGDYDWYSVPKERLPNNFALVVCDGPPGHTPGGRYGLLPQMRDRLKPGCVLLLDDFQRREEREIMSRWANELRSEYVTAGSEKPYASLIVPGEASFC